MLLGATAGLAVVLNGPLAQAADPSMGFFVTSVGMDDGGNLGGVAGAKQPVIGLAKGLGTAQKVFLLHSIWANCT
mgnify:CR=1 FL=1